MPKQPTKQPKQRKRLEVPDLVVSPGEHAATSKIVGRLLGKLPPDSPTSSLVTEERLPIVESLVTEKSLSIEKPPSFPLESLPTMESLVTEESPKRGTLLELAMSIEYGKGHQRIYHDFTDIVLIKLKPMVRYFFNCLDRYREGQSNTTVFLSWKTLEQRTGLSHSSMDRYIQVLEREGLARRIDQQQGRYKEQGNKFWVFFVTSLVNQGRLVTEKSLPTVTHNNRKDLKEKNIKDPPLQIDPQKHSAVLALMHSNPELTYATALAMVEREGDGVRNER